MTSSSFSIGVQMKEIGPEVRDREAVRSRKRGSVVMSATAIGRPLAATRPVMPSPMA